MVGSMWTRTGTATSGASTKFIPAGWAPKAKFDEALAAAGLAVAEVAPVAPDPSSEISDAIAF
jgi:hypothetical protein